MKKVPNLNFTITAEGEKTHTTATLVKLVLAQAPERGFDFATMRARNRVADVVEAVKDGTEINLEDADYATAVQCVKDHRWGGSHPDLLKFAEQFGL